jgi:hypothetical protein
VGEDYTDEAMLQAIRRRLMDEISRTSGSSERIVNNVYGGSPFGLVERLGQEGPEPGAPDPYEYMVDIDREDVKDPETGEKVGWKKKVRRYRTATGMPGEKKK